MRAIVEIRDNWLTDYTAATGEHRSNDVQHDLLVELAETVQRQHRASTEDSEPAGCEPLAVLAFQPEALDSAAQFFLCLTANGPRVGGWVDRTGQGYTVDVLTKDGRRFTAEVRQVRTGDDGQYKLVLAEWDDDAGRGDRNRLITLDLYDELERIEVC